MKIPAELLTDRLILRPHREEDFEPFFASITNKAATQYLRFTTEERTKTGTKAFFDEILATMETDKPIFGLAVVEKGSQKYVGFFGLSSLKDGSGTEVFYVLLPEFWGKGYAAEAAKKIFEYAFSVLGLEKLVTFVPVVSKGSQRVVEKLGMQLKGEEEQDEFLQTVGRYVIEKQEFFDLS
ncbi:MAG: GNAT family N-acetyltransferase [Bacteroidota bacterium]